VICGPSMNVGQEGAATRHNHRATPHLPRTRTAGGHGAVHFRLPRPPRHLRARLRTDAIRALLRWRYPARAWAQTRVAQSFPATRRCPSILVPHQSPRTRMAATRCLCSWPISHVTGRPVAPGVTVVGELPPGLSEGAGLSYVVLSKFRNGELALFQYGRMDGRFGLRRARRAGSWWR
jgi:hypothetical protein